MNESDGWPVTSQHIEFLNSGFSNTKLQNENQTAALNLTIYTLAVYYKTLNANLPLGFYWLCLNK